MTAHIRLLLPSRWRSPAPGVTAPPPPPPSRLPSPAAASAPRYDPAHDLGPLFHDVQMAARLPRLQDVRRCPRRCRRPSEIAGATPPSAERPGFDLRAFVAQALRARPGRPAKASRSIRRSSHGAAHPAAVAGAHPAGAMLPSPTRRSSRCRTRTSCPAAGSARSTTGIPTSRCSDWSQSGRHGSRGQHARQLRATSCGTVGHIPNGNRTLLSGRSQPPYFGAMVGLYATGDGHARGAALPRRARGRARVLDGWGESAGAGDGLPPRRQAARRRAAQPLLGRPFRSRGPSRTARTTRSARRVPEAQRTDALSQHARGGGERLGLLQPLDARSEGSAHAGDDGSRAGGPEQPALSRRADDRRAAAAFAGGQGDAEAAARFDAAAEARRRALLAAAYDPDSGFFYDVRWRTGERVTDRPTLAAAAPLYFGLATPEQGRAVAARLGRDFLEPGGFVTTLDRFGAAVGRA